MPGPRGSAHGGDKPVSRSAGAASRMAKAALSRWVAVSAPVAMAMIVGALGTSWALTYLLGGAGSVVPHWYYAPIMFAGARFGPVVALVVALASGVLAGPLTYLDVDAGTVQDTARWATRSAFFVGGALMMSALVRPSLPSISDELRQRLEERRLREAVDNGELIVRYQPIVHLRTGALYGFEALVRWDHPDEGELAPDAFLGIAERSDIIHDLGHVVLTKACATAARWAARAEERGELAPCVTVNMSARELEAPDLISRVRDVLVSTGVDPRLVCIEITESTLVADLDLSVATLAGLRTLGVRIAVDDFGTGYSSLSVVHRFPIDAVKVDRTFVASLERHEGTATLLGGLVMLAKSLGLTIIAEGIETEREATTLTELEYELGQGYLYARPLLTDEADRMLEDVRVVEVPATADELGVGDADPGEERVMVSVRRASERLTQTMSAASTSSTDDRDEAREIRRGDHGTTARHREERERGSRG